MSDGVLTLSRRGGPGDFDQRFRGELAEDGQSYSGVWEKVEDGEWIRDFPIAYRRRPE